jgi:hypothetical protein
MIKSKTSHPCQYVLIDLTGQLNHCAILKKNNPVSLCEIENCPILHTEIYGDMRGEVLTARSNEIRLGLYDRDSPAYRAAIVFPGLEAIKKLHELTGAILELYAK